MKADNTGSMRPESVRERRKNRFKRLLHDKRAVYAVVAVAAALALVIFASAMQNIGDMRDYRKYFTAGQEAYYSGEYEAALSNLRKAAGYEQRDDCSVLTADCYIAMGNYDKAEEILRSMDTLDANISTRLKKIEELREVRAASELTTVAGSAYPISTHSLILNDMKLGNEVIGELLALYSLESLSLADNSIDDLGGISGLGGLITLDLSRNSISELAPLSGLSGLRTLYLDGNPVEDFTPLYELKNLATLSIKNIEISEKQRAELSKALPDCAIHCEENEEAVIEITLGGRSFRSDVEELDLSGLALNDISALSRCKNLVSLNLSSNNIYDLSPLMDIPGLSVLNIAFNQVSDLRPLMGIRSLTAVYASNNSISSTVPLGTLNNLLLLELDNNRITDCSGLRKLSYLRTLSLRNTGISDAMLHDLYPLGNLGSLDISDNPELSGEAVDELKSAVSQCMVTHSELAYSIVVGDRVFRNTDTVIDLSGLAISDISPVGAFHSPEILNLSNNQISNIYLFQNCSSIKSLNLAGNLVSDISPLSALQWLESLDLSNNLVEDVSPLCMLQNLTSLNLTGNQLTEEQIGELRVALPNCMIYY